MHEVEAITETNESEKIGGNADDSFSYVKIETSPLGYNSGRPYELRGREKDIKALALEVSKLAKAARQRVAKESKFRRVQKKIADVFDSHHVQAVFACVICMVSRLVRL